LDLPDVEPTNNAAVDEVFSVGVRALRPAVTHRKLSNGVQSQRGALYQSRLLTVTTTLKQQGRDVTAFLVEAWEAKRTEASGFQITRAWSREGNALLRW
jgi:transposase